MRRQDIDGLVDRFIWLKLVRCRRTYITKRDTTATMNTAKACGVSRSTLYLRIADGTFTTPVQLGSRLVGWPASEVYAINKARIAGKSNDDIRALVVALEQARAC